MKLPKARTSDIVEQNLGAESLIYDLTNHKAFNLNETLSIIYKACDGKTSFEELKRKHKFTDDFIYLALDELERSNLLADEYDSPLKSTNRREVIKNVGLATMFALPLIAGLTAPTAANAASGAAVDTAGHVYLGACAQNNVCDYDPNFGYIRCIDDRCCSASQSAGSGNPGAPIVFSNTLCATDPGGVVACDQFSDAGGNGTYGKCCSGQSSGTCVTSTQIDENCPYIVDGQDYGTLPGYPTTCNCTCV